MRKLQTNGLRGTVMPRLRRVNHMCSRTVSDPANRLLKRTDSEGSSSVAEKRSSAVPLFRSGHMSAICARLSKGKVGVQRGRKTAGCPSFLPPRRAPQSPALRRAHSPLRFSGKLPAVRGEHAHAVRMPRSAGAEKECRPDRANTLTQFASPGQPVLKKLPPRSGEPPARFVRPA